MSSPNMLSRQLWLLEGYKMHLNEINECPSLPWISRHKKDQSSHRKFPCFIAALHGESPVAAVIGFIGCFYATCAKNQTQSR